MIKFKYRALGSSSESLEGEAEAEDKFALARDLKSKGYLLVVARPVRVRRDFLGGYLDQIFGRVKLQEKAFFASNLSSMLAAGLSLSRALSVMERQTRNKKFKSIVHDLIWRVDRGESFSSALSIYPDVFSSIFVAMVTSGEESGKLPESLKIVGDQLGKIYALRRKIRGALIYPAIVVAAMVLISIGMLIYVVPTLAQTFEELKADLPFTTKVVIFLSRALLDHYLIFFGVVGVGGYLGYKFLKSQSGQHLIDTILLKVPLFAKLARQYNSAVTARTLSSLISAGVDIVESIRITRQVIQNHLYQNVLAQAVEVVQKGESLATVFVKHENLYPPFVGEMTEVGEETGKLPDMLLKMAVFYEEEVDAATRDLSTVVEPILMVVIGAGVGFFALSMIQPIYGISEAL